jgi:Na+-driven multidrug efflux pump
MIARIFTTDPETVAEIVETLPMISLYILVSGIQGA